MSYLRKIEMQREWNRSIEERRKKRAERDAQKRANGLATKRANPPKLKEGEVHPFRRLLENMTGWKNKKTLKAEAKLEKKLREENEKEERRAKKDRKKK